MDITQRHDLLGNYRRIRYMDKYITDYRENRENSFNNNDVGT